MPTARDPSPPTGLSDLVSEQLPVPSPARPFWLLGVDTTPNPRPFAATLADRGVVYQPNPAPGNKPIAVGHCQAPGDRQPHRNRPMEADSDSELLPVLTILHGLHRLGPFGHRGRRRLDLRFGFGPLRLGNCGACN